MQARILLDHLQRRIRMERDKSAKVNGAKEAAVVVNLKTGASKSPSKKGDETPVLTEAKKTLAFLEEQVA